MWYNSSFMKLFIYTTLSIIIFFLTLWLIAWLFSHKTYDVSYGLSFNQNHATSLGLDWRVVYEEMLRDLRPEYLRIAAMWSEVQPEQGVYDFSDVDWMIDMAASYDAKVLMVVGQKAPRWPECYVPSWAKDLPLSERRDALRAYVRETVARYKGYEALDLWQVENEAFIRFEFGECEGFDQDVVPEEIALVREMDPDRKIVMTDSGELATWRRPSRLGDILGTTMYRIVRTPGGSIVSYGWLPPGFYRLKAGLWGKTPDTFFVTELQAEPWFTDATPLDTPISVMEETMTPERFQSHVDYATHVGASRVYVWGVEWWYLMKTVHGDSRYWTLFQDHTAR